MESIDQLLKMLHSPKCFLPWDSLFTKPGNRALVDDVFIFWHRPYYVKIS